MHQRIITAAVAFVVLSLSAGAAAQNRSFERPAARSAQGRGAALSLPSNASPRAVLAQYLRGQGRDQATVDSLVEANRNPGRQGITHVQFEQRVAGLPVYGTYAKAAFGAGGELLNVIENIASVPSSVRRAAVSGEQAIAAAIAHLYPELRTVTPGFFHRMPSAAAVAIPGEDGSMAAGFLVETWTERDNQLHHTLIGGDGEVLFVESRTNNDSYNVFQINPKVTHQELASGPGAGNLESPIGWLSGGTQGSTNIRGNNASAYLDAVSDNASDANGTAVSDGNFLTSADLTASPRRRQIATLPFRTCST